MNTITTDKKALKLFYIITICMSVIFEGSYIIASHIRGTQSLLIMLGLMWTPGIAAIITAHSYYRKQHVMGICVGKLRYVFAGILIPVVYLGVSYAVSWFILKDNTIGINALLELLGYSETAEMSKSLYFIQFLIVSLLTSCISALGEELGWRGFLYPVMERVYGRKKAVFLNGIIWACWHMPLIIAGLYQSKTTLWYGLPMFAITVVLLTGIMAWLRMASGSVIPALMLHASHNLFDQSVFQYLSINPKVSYLAGEQGIITAVCMVIILFSISFIWKKNKGQLAENK